MLDSKRTYTNFFVFWLFSRSFPLHPAPPAYGKCISLSKGSGRWIAGHFLQSSAEGTCAIALLAQQNKADINLHSLFPQGNYSEATGEKAQQNSCSHLEEVKTWGNLEMRVNVC